MKTPRLEAEMAIYKEGQVSSFSQFPASVKTLKKGATGPVAAPEL